MDALFNKCVLCGEAFPQKDLKFFKFPRNKARCNMWLDVVNAATGTSMSVSDKLGRICEKHFNEQDFMTDKRMSLKPSACPTASGLEEMNSCSQVITADGYCDNDAAGLTLSIIPLYSEDGSGSGRLQCGQCEYLFGSLLELMNHKHSAAACSVSDAVLVDMASLETLDTSSEQQASKVVSLYLSESDTLSGAPIYVASPTAVAEEESACHIEICVQEGSNQEKLVETSKCECKCCGKKFDKSYSLKQHERTHTGERPFQCVICGRSFSQKSNLGKHMVRHRVWPHVKETLQTGDSGRYSCQYCSELLETYSHYKKHISQHSALKVFRCVQKQCSETFADLDELLTHLESHPDASYQCHVCHVDFDSLKQLSEHQAEHGAKQKKKEGETRQFKCEVCSSAFQTHAGLQNHTAVESHHYECPYCRNVFTSERFLRRHLATHAARTSGELHACSQCDKKFRSVKLLESHAMVHSDTKPYSCVYCQKPFTSNFALMRHVGMHWTRRFECPFKSFLGCDKKFYRKDKLQDHILTHTNVKGLKSCQCKVCFEHFATLSRLQRHTKKQHGAGEKPEDKAGTGLQLQCNKCCQRFRKERQLIQHCCTIGERVFNTKDRAINDMPSNT